MQVARFLLVVWLIVTSAGLTQAQVPREPFEERFTGCQSVPPANHTTTMAFHPATTRSTGDPCWDCPYVGDCVSDMNALMYDCDQNNPTKDCYSKAYRYYVLCMRIFCPLCTNP